MGRPPLTAHPGAGNIGQVPIGVDTVDVVLGAREILGAFLHLCGGPCHLKASCHPGMSGQIMVTRFDKSVPG
jgi:hypothetical protein